MQTRKHFSVAWGVATVAALVGTVGVGSLSSQEPETIVPTDGLVCLLVNKNSGRCLSVAQGAADSGAKIVQGPAPNEAGVSERWRLLGAGKAFRLRNENSGLVLQVWSSNRQPGVQAVQSADQVSKEHQHWTLEPKGDAYLLRAGHSQLVLGVANSSREEGARVIQWNPIPDLADQLWVLRAPDDRRAIAPDGAQAPPPPEETNSWLEGWRLLAVLLAIAILLATGIIIWQYMRDRRMRRPGG